MERARKSFGLKKTVATVALGFGLVGTIAATNADKIKQVLNFKDRQNPKIEQKNTNQHNDVVVPIDQRDKISDQKDKTTYPLIEALSSGGGDLKIDRSTYKISCVNCSSAPDLVRTINLVNSMPMSDVNKQVVVAMFLWIEDNLPADQQLNNKIAVLVTFGYDEGTITDMREGSNPFRYDYANVNAEVQKVIDWFKSQSATKPDFVSNLVAQYGLVQSQSTGLNLDNADLSNPKVVEQLVAQEANKTPINTLLQNPTFRQNFQDAQNLKGKRLDFADKKVLSDDEKIMLAMEEYRYFKEYPSVCTIEEMRAFLSAYLDEPAYMDPDKITDQFVIEQYFQTMREIENKMKTKEHLSPSYKNIVNVDDEDL